MLRANIAVVWHCPFLSAAVVRCLHSPASPGLWWMVVPPQQCGSVHTICDSAVHKVIFLVWPWDLVNRQFGETFLRAAWPGYCCNQHPMDGDRQTEAVLCLLRWALTFSVPSMTSGGAFPNCSPLSLRAAFWMASSPITCSPPSPPWNCTVLWAVPSQTMRLSPADCKAQLLAVEES